MKKLVTCAFVMVMCSALSVLAAEAETVEKESVASITVDVLSAYVWRGLTFNDGLVVQPALNATHPSGLGFGVWGDFDVNDYNGKLEKREFSEVDLTLEYALPLEGPFGVSIGYGEYLYTKEGNYTPEVPEGHPEVEPVKDTDTREVYLAISYSPIEALSLKVTLNRDVDESEGLYTDIALAYTYSLTDVLSAEAGAHIGLADKKFAEANAGGIQGGFFDWGASLKLTYAVADGLGVSAVLNYTDNVDEDAFPDESVDVNWYGGVSATLSF